MVPVPFAEARAAGLSRAWWLARGVVVREAQAELREALRQVSLETRQVECDSSLEVFGRDFAGWEFMGCDPRLAGDTGVHPPLAHALMPALMVWRHPGWDVWVLATASRVYSSTWESATSEFAYHHASGLAFAPSYEALLTKVIIPVLRWPYQTRGPMISEQWHASRVATVAQFATSDEDRSRLFMVALLLPAAVDGTILSDLHGGLTR